MKQLILDILEKHKEVCVDFGGDPIAVDEANFEKIAEEIEKLIPLPPRDEAVNKGFRIAKYEDYNLRRTLKTRDQDTYFSGWMDCFDWLVKKKLKIKHMKPAQLGSLLGYNIVRSQFSIDKDFSTKMEKAEEGQTTRVVTYKMTAGLTRQLDEKGLVSVKVNESAETVTHYLYEGHLAAINHEKLDILLEEVLKDKELCERLEKLLS